MDSFKFQIFKNKCDFRTVSFKIIAKFAFQNAARFLTGCDEATEKLSSDQSSKTKCINVAFS